MADALLINMAGDKLLLGAPGGVVLTNDVETPLPGSVGVTLVLAHEALIAD